MWKRAILVLLCLNMCLADDLASVSARKRHGYHHIFHGGLYYLTFLAIKAKIVLMIGFAITSFFVFGKFFALIKYATFMFARKKECPQAKEQIYFEKPYYHDHYSGGPDVHFDHSPYEDHDHPPNGKERSLSNKIIDNINYIKDIIKGVDLTELVFEQMKIKSQECRKRFVCEVDMKARKNTLVGLGLYMFTDMGFEKYRTKAPVDSMQDCAENYPDCLDETKTS